MSRDPFSYYNFDITSNPAMRGTVSSLYSLLITIGVVGILITLIVTALKLMSYNANQRIEALNDLKWKIITSLAIFCMPAMIGTIMKIVSEFV